MHKAILAAVGAGALMVSGAAAVHADSFWELEHARANARAGGPTNARDAELLERYGCLSGTRSAFCERVDRQQRRPYRAKRKRVQR